MRTCVVAVLWCVIAGQALADAQWPIDVPAGWEDRSDAAATQLQNLRGIPGTVGVDGALWIKDEVQLTVLVWRTRGQETLTRSSLEEIERGIFSGSSKQATKQLSYRSSFVGDQLHAEQIDEVGDARVHQVRILAGDTSEIAHIVIVTCAGASTAIGPCETIQHGAKLNLRNQSVLGTSESIAYKIGYVLPVLAAIIGAIFLAVYNVVRRRSVSRRRS
ncbi:MAG: hypothetical protein JWO36_700 [Myxococcales bacterium]|nr:hypothetical protein [Myxococcales bacterium]